MEFAHSGAPDIVELWELAAPELYVEMGPAELNDVWDQDIVPEPCPPKVVEFDVAVGAAVPSVAFPEAVRDPNEDRLLDTAVPCIVPYEFCEPIAVPEAGDLAVELEGVGNGGPL